MYLETHSDPNNNLPNQLPNFPQLHIIMDHRTKPGRNTPKSTQQERTDAHP